MQAEAVSDASRVKELMAKKRKLLTKIKRNKRSLIKSRIEKNKINEELLAIKARFAGMTSDEARAAVAVELDAISTDDIFPKKLERKFDRLDKRGPKHDERQVVDLTGTDSAADNSSYKISGTGDSDGDVVVVASTEAEEEASDIPDVDIGEEEAQDDEEVLDFSNE